MTTRTVVTLFTGGHGGASIARQLLRTPGVELSLVVNGYDNGFSTGALRRYLPGMLGPSDFRKNLALLADPDDPGAAAFRPVLADRLPGGAERSDLDELVAALAGGEYCPAIPVPARAEIVANLTALVRRLDQDPGLDLSDCAVGNLVLAGGYLRAGGDFNAAVDACASIFRPPVRLLNVTSGENAFLVALKQDGRLLADEADIVAPQDAVPIVDLLLLRQPLAADRAAELAGRPVAAIRRVLARDRAELTLNPAVRSTLERSDVILYGPGTPHSSLLPSYLTSGVAEAIAASRARARVFVVNLREDHDVQGVGGAELASRTLAYLGDPGNERRTITHVLSDRPPPEPGALPGSRWVTVDLADPARPAVHCGRRTVTALTEIGALPGVLARSE